MTKNNQVRLAIFDYRSKRWAYIFWLFLGALGVHKLYLKQFVEFVLYLGLTMFGAIYSLGNIDSYLGAGVLLFVGLLLFVDIFRIPFSVKRTNRGLDKREEKQRRIQDEADAVRKERQSEAFANLRTETLPKSRARPEVLNDALRGVSPQESKRLQMKEERAARFIRNQEAIDEGWKRIEELKKKN